MGKIGSITYRSKTFMIKTDHQSIRLNLMQYFQTYFDLNTRQLFLFYQRRIYRMEQDEERRKKTKT